jgi:hypothetical protein
VLSQLKPLVKELLGEESLPRLLLHFQRYDMMALPQRMEAIQQLETLIHTCLNPPKKNTQTPWVYDEVMYQSRHLIENVFQRLKALRRIATHYEKTALQFSGLISIAYVLD